MTEKSVSAAFLNERQLAERQNRSVRSIQNDRIRKTNGIPFHKFGTSIRYSIEDVLAYEARARATSTSSNAQHVDSGPCSKQYHDSSVVMDPTVPGLTTRYPQKVPSSNEEGNS